MPRERIHVIPHGLNLAGHGTRSEHPGEPFTIGYLARICPDKGLHNLLASLYNLLYYTKFRQVLNTLEAFAANQTRRSSPNTEILLFQYLFTNRINACFLEGRFTEGLTIIPDLLNRSERK